MIQEPFAEPNDSERTVFRPRPSGAVGARPPSAAPAAAPPPVVAAQGGPTPKTGTNPLVAAAGPVLAAAIRIAGLRGSMEEIERLRRAMIEAVQRFEADALAIDMDNVGRIAARYALCATVDDIVLSTPEGRQSSWAHQSMTQAFHGEVTGGERFYEILATMQKNLGRYEPVVELMYLCTSLGFVGQYRVMERGSGGLNDLRESVYRSIRQWRGDFERELSPRWRGIAAGTKTLARRIPVWAVGLASLVLVALLYVLFAFLLSQVSDEASLRLQGLPPHGQIVVPRVAVQALPPAQAAAQPAPVNQYGAKIETFLAPEVRAGQVAVLRDAQAVTIRLFNRNMFGSGEAQLASSYIPLLQRIAAALNDEAGAVLVYGYTDDRPIRTPRFPSNFELSQARADAVAALLKAGLKDPSRIKTQGKGSADPIASNANADGQQQNRRTEIVLVRPSDAQ